MKTPRLLVPLVFVPIAFVPIAHAQQPSSGQAAPPAVATPATPEKPAPTPYTYDPAGRRDPFVSLLGRGSDPHGRGSRPAGLSGILIGEISLKGIVRDRNGLSAIVQGPDNRSYVMHAGDRLLDGSVKSITPDGVVFSQDVNDPLSLVKQREIRKSLRSNEESRG